VALLISILLLIAMAFLRSFAGDRLTMYPGFSISLPSQAATGWNAQTVRNWINVIPHQSTFIETLLSLPLFIGWIIHNHPIWGLPVLFCGTLFLLGLWRLVAHVFGMRKPSMFFSALIVLQCAALSWGWTFYAPAPYYLRTKLSVVDMKSTFAGILSDRQQISWHQQNGYRGFVFKESQHDQYKTQFPKIFFIDPATAQTYNTQLSPNADWWVFPENTSSETQLKTNWKSGKVAAVSLDNAPLTALEHLPPASKTNVFFSLIALLLFAILYGMQPASAPLSAPGRVTDFLQKRRRLKRWGGLAMMVLAFVGTLLALWLTFYPAWGFVRLETLPLTTTALLCVALDYCYWQGRKSWKKVH
jgi:hypothetical protein